MNYLKLLVITLLLSSVCSHASNEDKVIGDMVLVGGEKPDISKMPSASNEPIQIKLPKTGNTICDLAGNLGALAVSYLPTTLKRAVCKVCADNAQFQKEHKNVNAALACQQGDSQKALTPEENESLCKNVIGKAGSSLNSPSIDAATRKELAQMCCNTKDFVKNNPNASRTLHCVAYIK